jgi:23S rRNA G2445 N2-methylase RlmL
MHQFQKSRIKLLEELRDLVTETLREGQAVAISRDIRRYNRMLKALRKEIDKWITEMMETEKLREQERRLNEEKRKKVEEYYVSDPSDRNQ